jgi:hypothetical protein
MLSSLYRKVKIVRSDLLTYSRGKFAEQIELAFSNDVDWIGQRSYYGCASTTWFMLTSMIRRMVKVVTAGHIVFRFRFDFGLVVMLLADVDRGKGRVSGIS